MIRVWVAALGFVAGAMVSAVVVYAFCINNDAQQPAPVVSPQQQAQNILSGLNISQNQGRMGQGQTFSLGKIKIVQKQESLCSTGCGAQNSQNQSIKVGQNYIGQSQGKGAGSVCCTSQPAQNQGGATQNVIIDDMKGLEELSSL